MIWTCGGVNNLKWLCEKETVSHMSDAGSFKVNTIRRKIAIDMGFLFILITRETERERRTAFFLERHNLFWWKWSLIVCTVALLVVWIRLGIHPNIYSVLKLGGWNWWLLLNGKCSRNICIHEKLICQQFAGVPNCES